jgi:hypothetical protein
MRSSPPSVPAAWAKSTAQRFLVNVRTAPSAVEPLTVVVDWLASVQR